LRPDPSWLEDMTVTADRDPYFAFPKLYGAPAYARPPRAVPEPELPLNPDDLPIAAEQTEQERTYAAMLQPSHVDRPGDHARQPGGADGEGERPTGLRRFGLRALTDRGGSRDR